MRGALPNSEAAILLMGYVAMNHKAYERNGRNNGYETDAAKFLAYINPLTHKMEYYPSETNWFLVFFVFE
jgi:hypothetical protein